MITDAYDPDSRPIVTPEGAYGRPKSAADTCIVTFSHKIFTEVRRTLPSREIGAISASSAPEGRLPVCLTEYEGQSVAFFMSMMGSSCTGGCLEAARQISGAKRFIMFGSAGSLDRRVTAGRLIVPTHAYRDEGISYHYAPSSDYIEIKTAQRTAAALERLGLPCVLGRTWTTDAIFRETETQLRARRAEGCIAVDMECAGAQAVCDFIGVEFYEFFIAGDVLDASEWNREGLAAANHDTGNFFIALKLAREL